MTQNQTNENISLAPGVVDTIIAITVNGTDGVASLGTSSGGFFARLFNKPSTNGIETHFNEEEKLEITLHISVEYGHVLPELAEKLRQSISDALLVQVGIEVASIDIYVDGIQFEQK